MNMKQANFKQNIFINTVYNKRVWLYSIYSIFWTRKV